MDINYYYLSALTATSYLASVAWTLYGFKTLGHVRKRSRLSIALAVTGLILHGLNLFVATQDHGQYRLAITDSASLIGWVMAVNAIVLMFVPGLGLLPVAILSAAASLSVLTGLMAGYLEPHPPWELAAHIALAGLAFAWFAIAAISALLLMGIHQKLHRRAPLNTWQQSLPPLETLERVLFQALTGGFIALSLALLTGFFYVTNPTLQHLWHKIIFTVLAWLTFATLLIGRLRYGWRAKRVLRFTLFGVANLTLGYFGSKLVLEFILGRHWG